MSHDFESLFRTSLPVRDKLLSRLFGIFSEDIVRIWCRCPDAPYQDLGRPRLRLDGGVSGSTLDFLLADRRDHRRFVAEMKCELEYDTYRYLTLTNPAQLEHHRKPAFEAFLQAAREPSIVSVSTAKGPVSVHGAVLVWGDATEAGKAATVARYGFHEVLTVAGILRDLNVWQPTEWATFLSERQRWATELFDGLRSLKGA